MKTLAESKKYLEWLILDNGGNPSAKIETMKSVVMYLETNPTEDSIKKQLDEVDKKIDIVESRKETWLERNQGLLKSLNKLTPRQQSSYYYSINDMAKLRHQKKVLGYILDDETSTLK